jgi:hypothetical protein
MLRRSCLISSQAIHCMCHTVTHINQLMHAPSICTISHTPPHSHAHGSPPPLSIPCYHGKSGWLVPLFVSVLPLKPHGCSLNPTLRVAVVRCFACLVLWTWSEMMRSPILVFMSCPLADLLLCYGCLTCKQFLFRVFTSFCSGFV